ncbi:MAG: hypothetical protein QOG87_3357 [Actinomycetota bacterium]|jgi:hypothetical protein
MTSPESTDAGDMLRHAWDAMIERLGRARSAIDDPALHPPPPDDRTLAEGYRYLLGFVFSAIERAFVGDQDFPYFRRAIQLADKSTIDNADAMYLETPIDGSRTYRIRGRAGDVRHWRGEPPAATGRKAPPYVIFEAHTGYAGDSGSLAELRPGGGRAGTGTLDIADLEVEPDGSFEILAGPDRPSGHTGNFLPTRRTSQRTKQTHTADHLSMRVLFGDWEREDPLELHIAQIGKEGEHPPPLDPATAAAKMARVAEIVDNQMRFWNEFYAVVLETYQDMNGDGERYMPRNDLNAPSRAGLATGGGQSTNVYAGGVYELGPDEALVIETRTPIAPAYAGFGLSNLWGESHDYANRISSLNSFQAEADDDGAVRYVVAHHDPGVPNWIDTTGLEVGFMTHRWTYSKPPEPLPTAEVTKVEFNEIRAHLQDATGTVTAGERREQIRIRQEHVQRRFRQS